MADATTSKITAGLIALVLATSGGAAFLHNHQNPTLREVFLACEKGQLHGIACCEDMERVSDMGEMLQQCGMVTPENHDPFGIRAKEENDWDQALKEGK